MNNQNEVVQKIGKYRWVIVALLLFSTTFNYLDRQVIAYLKPFFCSEGEFALTGFHWSNTDFSIFTSFFTGFYGIMTIFAGFLIDKVGNKLGLAFSLIFWSIFGILNAFVGSVLAMHVVIRSLFGMSEAPNFPASNKAIAEWFPKKERALAISIFNSGSNLGAMFASLFVPWCMAFFGADLGWKMSFIITGAIGFIWLPFWFKYYDSPDRIKNLDKAEYDYILSDGEEKVASANENSGKVSYGNLVSFNGRANVQSYWGTFLMINIIGGFVVSIMLLMRQKGVDMGIGGTITYWTVGLLYAWFVLALEARRLHDSGKNMKYLLFNLIPVIGTLYVLIYAGMQESELQANKYGEIANSSILAYRPTWAFFFGKFFTDGVWWFYLFWLPDFLTSQFHMSLLDTRLPTFIVFFVSIVGSIYGASIPMKLINNGMGVYKARMTTMIFIAFIPLVAILTPYVGDTARFGASALTYAVIVISIACIAHQAWSANLFSTVSDMFPKKAVASVTGVGAMAGGLGGVLIQILTGVLRDVFPSSAFLILFVICGTSYIVAWPVMKLLVPKHKIITLD